MKKTLLSLLVFAFTPLSALAITQQDVDFAQRQCAQRNDYDKCQTAKNLASAYNEQKRNQLEYDAAVKAGKPMQGSTKIETNVYIGGDNRGGYNWNSRHNKYCYHNSDGSVYKCVN